MTRNPQLLFQEAQRYIPGGVNSPVRAFNAVGTLPLFVKSASGSKIYDSEEKEYIDYICSWGPLILGHSHPAVVEAIQKAAEKGTSYGMSTEIEIELAEMIVKAFPSIDMIRMVNSGTEATMSAIRLARGYTGRSKIIKFDGCYHGHADPLLVKAGSGIATFEIDGHEGIPRAVAALTIVLPYNDTQAFENAVEKYGDDIACAIVEPVAGNMGVVAPVPDFLETLRRVTSEKGIVLIFDEVITGFRLTYGGFQNLVAIKPDLTCLGKIIGGGLPVGAFGGCEEIMKNLAPTGPVYQAGTLSGNPLVLAAGLATLRILKDKDYKQLENKTEHVCREMENQAEKRGITFKINRVGSLFTPFFSSEAIFDFRTARTSNTALFAKFFSAMLEKGIVFPPSQFEASSVSFAHTDEDIEKTLQCSSSIFNKL